MGAMLGILSLVILYIPANVVYLPEDLYLY